MKNGTRWVGILVFCAGQALAQVPSRSPLETVRLSNERVQAILKNRAAIDNPTETALFEVMDGATDFGTISRRVIDAFRAKLSEVEYAEFDRTFRELLRKSSLRKLGRYRADRFEYVGEEVRGETALVRTLAFYEEEQVRLDYQMERVSGRWVIVNYIVDDVDTVRNYRKQFVRLFAGNDFDGVIRRLKAKIAEIDEER